MNRFVQAIFLATVVASNAAMAQAPAYPSRTIKILVPAAPSASEATARHIAIKLSETLGQAVSVENRPGGGGQIAINALLASPPDGYTFLITPNVLTIAPVVIKNLSYDPLRDLAPLGRLGYGTFVLVTNPDLPVKSLDDLVALARSKPGELNFGSPGEGTPQFFSMEYIRQARGYEVTYIPTLSPTTIIETAAGRIHAGVYTLAQVLPLARAGKLRILATIGTARSPAIPEIPSIKEAGIDGLESPWIGMFAPGRTPPEIINRVSREVLAIMATSEAYDLLIKQGVPVAIASPDEFQAQIKRELEMFKQVGARSGIQAK